MTRRTAISNWPVASGQLPTRLLRNATMRPLLPSNNWEAKRQRPIAKGQQPLTDQLDKSAEFKRWLALFFIGKGNYKITDKGYEELAPQVTRQNLEFGEPVSDRKREPRLEERRSLTKSELREAVARKVEQMLRDGKAEELYDNRYIDKPKRLDWKSKDTKLAVIKKLVELLGKNPREITAYDFNNNGLGGLLVDYYKNSPYLALVEASYAYSLDEIKEHARTGFKTDKIYPWEMSRVGNEFWYDKEMRIAATKWLMWKLNKEPKDITQDDFRHNSLGGLLATHYNVSHYLALLEAGYAYSEDEIKEQNGEFRTDKFYPWEMGRIPFDLWPNKDIRIAAIKWLIWKLKKEPKEIIADDFNNNRLSGLLRPYKGSPYLALVEVGYAYSIDEIKEHARTWFKTDKLYPWEMQRVGNEFWYDKEMRIAATKWLMWKLNKEPKDITQDDFINNGLGGLIQTYNGSPYEALFEAGIATESDEAYMRSSHHTH